MTCVLYNQLFYLVKYITSSFEETYFPTYVKHFVELKYMYRNNIYIYLRMHVLENTFKKDFKTFKTRPILVLKFTQFL